MKKIIQYTIVKSIGLYLNTLSYIAPKKALHLAYALFSQPRNGKLNENKLPKTLQKAEKIKFYYNHQEFQTYLWKGNEEIVLLIHGWESNTSRWKKLLVPLKKTGKTIIAIDAPAHGLSSGKDFNVPTYAAFINVIVQKYNPKIAIGHSIGGNTIAYFQANYNHSFEKIVLLGAPSDFKVILDNYIKLLSLNAKIYQSLIDYTKQRFNIIIEDFSAAKFLKNSSIEGIIAHDIQDQVVAFEEGKKIANSWHQAKFIATKGLGHSLHDESLYDELIEFIKKI